MATAYGWDDAQAALVEEDANAVDPELAAEPIDSFELVRKDSAVVARAASLAPRLPEQLLAGVPEAHGVVVRNIAEDCTRH